MEIRTETGQKKRTVTYQKGQFHNEKMTNTTIQRKQDTKREQFLKTGQNQGQKGQNLHNLIKR